MHGGLSVEEGCRTMAKIHLVKWVLCVVGLQECGSGTVVGVGLEDRGRGTMHV